MAWSFERILSFVRGPYWFPCCVAVFVVSLQAHLPYGHFRLLKFVARKVSLPCSSTKLLPPFLALASARFFSSNSGGTNRELVAGRFEMEGDAAGISPAAPPVKRRRGRPRKSELPPTPSSAKDAVGSQKATGTGTDSTKPRKQRKRKGVEVAPASVDVSMIGQQVTGVLDGTFDAGYLLSVRVGSSDMILRGVVFGPGLSVPLSRVNDIAPGVKQVRREEMPLPPASKLPIPPKPPTPAKLPIVSPSLPFVVQTPPPPPSAVPPTSAVLEAAAAVFGNAVSAASSPAPPSTGLVAALQQLPGGGYTPDPSTFSQPTFQSESAKQVTQQAKVVQSGA